MSETTIEEKTVTLEGKTVTLIVGGSIAAYKSCELVRELKRAGAEVFVVLTEAAKEFVTPLTLQTLSGNRIRSEFFDPSEEARIGHIELADKADLVLVAPATANLLSRAAAGVADDLATAVLLAAKAPVVFAPAMNVNMWNHAATQASVGTLELRGAIVIPPAEGELACGWEGAGRLPELTEIMRVLCTLHLQRDFQGIHVVVTAGPTREYLDPIRFLSNSSSGKMGYALAVAARQRGAHVTLISGPVTLPVPNGVEFVSVVSAAEMERAVQKALSQRGKDLLRRVLFMAAAVSDHRPKEISKKKIKNSKQAGATIELVPNTDIIAGLAKERSKWEGDIPTLLVSFAAESGERAEVLGYAAEKLTTKNVDCVIANSIDEGFGGDENHVFLMNKNGDVVESPRAQKWEVARWILGRVLTLSQSRREEVVPARPKKRKAVV